MVSRDLVDVLTRGQLLAGPEGVVPAAADDPVARRCRLRVVGNALLHLRQRLHADQVNLQQKQSAGSQMQVSIVEAGHNEMSAEIDDFGVAAFQFADVVIRADGDDASVTDCHGLSARRRGLGVDVAVEEDHVGSVGGGGFGVRV